MQALGPLGSRTFFPKLCFPPAANPDKGFKSGLGCLGSMKGIFLASLSSNPQIRAHDQMHGAMLRCLNYF